MKPPNIKALKCTLFSRVKGHKGSPVLQWLLASIVRGSLLQRAHSEFISEVLFSLMHYGKYSNRGVVSALGCASCFIGSRPRPRAIFPVMHSHGTLTSIRNYSADGNDVEATDTVHHTRICGHTQTNTEAAGPSRLSLHALSG